MPKTRPNKDAEAFGRRLVSLLGARGQPRRGAGAYLHRKYGVAVVTANAWLNGDHKPEPPLARRIAADHGGTFDALYWGDETQPASNDDDWTDVTGYSQAAGHVSRFHLRASSVERRQCTRSAPAGTSRPFSRPLWITTVRREIRFPLILGLT